MQLHEPGKARAPVPWVAQAPYPMALDMKSPFPCEGCSGTGFVGWNRCPRSMSDAESRSAVRFWSAKQLGVMPRVIGEGEQTARGAELISLVGMEIETIREEQFKKHAR